MLMMLALGRLEVRWPCAGVRGLAADAHDAGPGHSLK